VVASRQIVKRLYAHERTSRGLGADHGAAMGSIHDLTNRIEELEGEIDLCQLLLEEIIHRTKNAIQSVIASLWDYVESSSDAKIRRIVLGIQKQVLTIARAHDRFYGSGETDARMRVTEICESVRSAAGEYASQITFRLNVADIRLQRYQEICLSLILQELLTNAFKHAFPRRKQGSITVELTVDDLSVCHLVVGDDGTGQMLPPNASSGMTLVEAFASLLRGRLLVTSDKGTTVKMSFPLAQGSTVRVS
jgi:two-component sensor histidine kinase